MKKILLMTLTSMLVMTSCIKEENPLLAEKWNTPYETPPFSKIKPEHFDDAIPVLIDEARVQMDSIIYSTEAPTFSNTVEAMEFVGKRLERALGIFYNITETNASDELQAIAEKISPILTAYSNDISLNEKLFERIKAINDYYSDSLRLSELSAEQQMLLKVTYNDFVRSGALLSDQQKQKKREISEKLNLLTLKFAENSRKSTNKFSITIKDSSEVSGVPSWGLAMAREEAKADSVEGWKFTLQAPSYLSVIEYADNRDLREKMWRKYNTIALADEEFDNSDIIKEITDLRLQFAKLFGYETYADYVLEDRMAGNVSRVNSFLNELLDASYSQAKSEVRKIEEFSNSKGFWDYMQPWDFNYWSEKYRQENYDLNDDMTRPYFRIENVEKALFLLAEKLYGLQFKVNNDIETYDKDAKAYEVMDAEGNFLSILYLDYFPRPSKRSGAWMNTFRDAYVDRDGKEVRPIVTLVCNFTKPTEDEPSLLSFDEFQTILHEFGHGLHGMLAKGKYASLTGTNVHRDFVELPSQLMENWAYQKEYLDLWAVHYKTGEVIPGELVDKIIASKNFNSAFANVRQLMFAMLDMSYHTLKETPINENIVDFETKAVERTQVLPYIPGTGRSTSFTHIFSGGYAAGYYSYKWSEMLEADAFEVFKQNGIFDDVTAKRFRHLLESGRSVDAMNLFVEFVGHEPTIEPLLEKLGINGNK